MRSFSFIRSSTQSRVAWIEFYRRPVNAFTRDMVVETRDAIASALSDPTARVVVIARGRRCRRLDGRNNQ